MVTNLTQLAYVNNYDKNRYLKIFSKAAVYQNTILLQLHVRLVELLNMILKRQMYRCGPTWTRKPL